MQTSVAERVRYRHACEGPDLVYCPHCLGPFHVKPILFGLYHLGAEERKTMAKKYIFGGCCVKKENMYCLMCEKAFLRPSCIDFDMRRAWCSALESQT